MHTIGLRIKYLRKKNGDSMSKLGMAIGTDSANISNWENDKRIPGGKFIIALAEYYNITTDWLLRGQEIEIKNYTEQANLTEKATALEFFLPTLAKEDQNFIKAFIEFYRNYKLKVIKPVEGIQTEHFINLPLLKNKLLNKKLFADENLIDHVRIPISLASMGDFLVTAPNNLLTVGITIGDLIIVKQQKHAKNGQLVIVAINESLLIYTIHKRQQTILLKSVDQTKEIEFTNSQGIQIHGIVTGVYKPDLT